MNRIDNIKMLQSLELKKELFIKRHNKPLSDDYFIHKKLLGEGSFGCVYLGYKLNPKSD
jgi:hypothetical protein